MPNAQAGQFVVNDTGSGFEFSSMNRDASLANSKDVKKIIQYMTDNYQTYSNPGSRGVSIPPFDDKELFANCIATHNSDKNVKYVMTSEKGNLSNYIIFPSNAENLLHYFNITAKYRVKRSGSHRVPKSKVDDVLAGIRQKYNDASLNEDGTVTIQDVDFKFDRIELNDNMTVMLRKIGDNVYTMRLRSNTANANVIFSLSKNDNPQQPKDLDAFKKELNKKK